MSSLPHTTPPTAAATRSTASAALAAGGSAESSSFERTLELDTQLFIYSKFIRVLCAKRASLSNENEIPSNKQLNRASSLLNNLITHHCQEYREEPQSLMRISSLEIAAVLQIFDSLVVIVLLLRSGQRSGEKSGPLDTHGDAL